MDWIGLKSAPETSVKEPEEDGNNFMTVHPDTKSLLSKIGLWPKDDTERERVDGDSGRHSSRPYVADEEVPPLPDDNDANYWRHAEVLASTLFVATRTHKDVRGKRE